MNDNKIGKLIDGLEDFRLRSDCIKKLVLCGEDAVAPLTEALTGAPSEGAKWAMVKALGEIHDTDAVPALAPLLKDQNISSAVREALVNITGRDLGPDPGPWMSFSGNYSVETPEPFGDSSQSIPEMRKTGLGDERLMELIFDEHSACSYKKISDGKFIADITGEEGDSQKIRIHFSEKDHEGEPIVIVFSKCGPAREKDYEYALRRNLKMPYGALAIAGKGEDAQFVMFNTLLRQDMSAVELRKSLFTVAERAGQIGKSLRA